MTSGEGRDAVTRVVQGTRPAGRSRAPCLSCTGDASADMSGCPADYDTALTFTVRLDAPAQ